VTQEHERRQRKNGEFLVGSGSPPKLPARIRLSTGRLERATYFTVSSVDGATRYLQERLEVRLRRQLDAEVVARDRRARALGRAARPAPAPPDRGDGRDDRRGRRVAPGGTRRCEDGGRVGSAGRSTRCSRRPSLRSARVRGPSSGCADSSPTRRTSCERRSPPCAHMESCSSAARRCIPRIFARSMSGIARESERMGPPAARPPRRRATARAGARRARAGRRRSGRRRTGRGRRASDRRIRGLRHGARRSRPASPGGRRPARERPRAHPAGHARVRRPAPHRRTRALSVSDTGPGLIDDQAAQAFELFYRVDTSRARASGGVGLGLSIVAAVTQAHGGTARARPRPGGGATFVVSIPVAGDHPGRETVPPARDRS
jgi:hypothetical protein